MATTPSKPQAEITGQLPGAGISAWPHGANFSNSSSTSDDSVPSRQDALQGLLAFSALHEQVRRRRSLALRLAEGKNGSEPGVRSFEFEQGEHLVLDEVLQLVAERAVAITGANGIAIALAENSEIVLRASAGTIKPDVGARIDRDSAFSGACFRTAQIVRCDDTESDPRVNTTACRALGARSMVAVPLCGRRRVIGLLEAFSTEPFGFNDTDIRSLSLLAELVLGALKPEDEDRFAESAEAASAKLESAVVRQQSAQEPLPEKKPTAVVPDAIETPATPAVVEAAEPKSVLAVDSPAAKDVASSITHETRPDVPENDAGGNHDRPNRSVGEDVPAHKRPGVLLVLALVVIAAIVAAVIWWKIKNVQPDGAISGSARSTSSTSGGGVSTGTARPSSPAPAIPAGTNAKTASDTNAKSDDLSDPAPQNASSANPQELSKFPRVTGIRHWSSADSSTVVLDLQDQVQYEAHRLTSPDRIYFDLHDTVLAPEVAATSIEIGDALLNRIRVAQPLPGMTRVVLETRGNSNFSVSLETNPYRLVVEVRKIGSNPKGAVNLFPDTADAEKNALAIIVPPPSKEDLQLRARVPKMRIVVDAGHGGWDLGTVGRRGLLEKDVVLEVAQRLGKLLESRLGMDVLYTRQDDNYIPLDERAEIANQAQADLFVSVHANYSDLPSARGVETYYTNFFSAPSTRDKDRETRASSVAIPTPATATLSAADLHERIEQSRRLAASVQRSLYGALSVENPGLRDRGIKEAGFVVLTETAMPGILAEVSFVSSPTDEQRLRSDGYREQIAEALYKGIARYAANSHAVKVASASSSGK
jgi:N-acetylmuramoyl-L-alanine amidase/putative methionine-R-sulfoxide reductase with GAF domain